MVQESVEVEAPVEVLTGDGEVSVVKANEVEGIEVAMNRCHQILTQMVQQISSISQLH